MRRPDPTAAMNADAGERSRLSRVTRRVGSILLYGVLPAVVLLAVAGYFVGLGVEHADPPVVAVQGHSMQPTLVTGDLVVLQGVNPANLRKGDIIAVTVPAALRAKYGLPPHVVHRIVGIQHTKTGPIFTTKGDNNPNPDIFTTPASDVVGEVKYKIPFLGYPLLFLGSRQGEIFLGAAGGIVLLYFLLGLWEDRRAYLEGVSTTMETLRQESDDLRRALEHSSVSTPSTRSTAHAARQTATIIERVPTSRLEAIGPSLGELAGEVRSASERSKKSAAMIGDLVGAVSEYGTHLKSHTAVMQHLAATTDRLELATEGLLRAVATMGGARSGGSGLAATGAPASVVELLERASQTIEAVTRERDRLQERIAQLERDAATGQHEPPQPPVTSPALPPIWDVQPLPRR